MTNTLYRMFDADGQLLYVGITLDFNRRLTEHSVTKTYWGDVMLITLTHFATYEEMEAAEIVAIAEERPLHNVKRRVRSAKHRESARRLSRFAEERQRHWFKAIRYFGHRARDDHQLQLAVQKAHESGVPAEDVRWALENPRRNRE